MNEKQFKGMLKASPEKRYHSFLAQVADNEEVWLLANEDGYVTFDDDEGNIFLMVWPLKEFAEHMMGEGDEAVAMGIDEFCEQLEATAENGECDFAVFPTDKDAFAIDAENLLADLTEALEEVGDFEE